MNQSKPPHSRDLHPSRLHCETPKTLCRWDRLALFAFLALVAAPLFAISGGPQRQVSEADIFGANNPDVAYNSVRNEFFVVWTEYDNSLGSEVFGRRLSATTGQPLGAPFRITDFGPPDIQGYSVESPRVVYNPIRNEYFVVFRGSFAYDIQLRGVRLAGSTGFPVGPVRQLSEMGSGASFHFAADFDVVLNPDAPGGRYLVVWAGLDDREGHAIGESEIYARHVSAATGIAEGVDDLQISQMGPLGDPNYVARLPQVVYDVLNRRYFVVWVGEHDADGQVEGVEEIFMQFLDGNDGQPLVDEQIRISGTGQELEPGITSLAVTHNPDLGHFLVAWSEALASGGSTVPSGGDAFLLRSQRVHAEVGAEIGPDDAFLLSHPVALEDLELVYDTRAQRYLLSQTLGVPGGAGRREIGLLELDTVAEPTGAPFRVSDTLPTPTLANPFAIRSALTLEPSTGEPLVVWQATRGLEGGSQSDVFGRWSPTMIFQNGFESGDLQGWSSAVGF
ncbi:MAG: hypothetical protein AAGN46_02210 [Acidobacteriota bacterium]